MTPRGTVLVVHGLGEHCGRYKQFASRLNEWGFAVRGYDHYGHGESGGKRGGLPSDNRLLEDLEDVIQLTRSQLETGNPLIIFGHSMGGLVAAKLVSMGIQVQALVLSSPALALGLGLSKKLVLAVMRRIAPDVCVANGIKAKYISHDLKAVQDYQNDPLVHDQISARLAQFILNEGHEVMRYAQKWNTPTLLLYAGKDKLVSPQGSKDFDRAVKTDAVESHCFTTMYHEIFNEIQKDKVYAKLKFWMDSKF